MMEITLRGEKLTLLPERAAYWHREHALLIADPHWGKAAAFRAGGIPVPAGTTIEAITRLEDIMNKTGAQQVIFLGDLLHAKAGRSGAIFSALGSWRDARPDVSVTLVRGNHDRRAGDPPAVLRFECVDAPHVIAPFVFAHHPAVSDAGYVIAGHVHPAIRLYGSARRHERLRCFAFNDDMAILPAFGDFTGMADLDREEWRNLYAIAEQEVISVK
jgi:uncharacterized protein